VCGVCVGGGIREGRERRQGVEGDEGVLCLGRGCGSEV
jgi:hypothetical protein